MANSAGNEARLNRPDKFQISIPKVLFTKTRWSLSRVTDLARESSQCCVLQRIYFDGQRTGGANSNNALGRDIYQVNRVSGNLLHHGVVS